MNSAPSRSNRSASARSAQSNRSVSTRSTKSPRLTEEVLTDVQSIAIFSELSLESQQALAKHITYTHCNKRQFLFKRGDVCDRVYFVIRGSLASIVHNKSEEITVAQFNGGDVVGEMAFFDVNDRPRSTDCRALESTDIVSINTESFLKFSSRHPISAALIRLKVLDVINFRLQSSNSFLVEMVGWGEAARKRSITDEMTGLFNRRYADETLSNLIYDAQINGGVLSVAILDIDSFGQYNQQHGDKTGDKAVVFLADVLKGVYAEEHMVLARYGGDEIVVLLPQTTCEQASSLASTLLESVANTLQGSEIPPFTISMGIAEYPRHTTYQDQIVSIADAALYQAKQMGRNRCEVYSVTASGVTSSSTDGTDATTATATPKADTAAEATTLPPSVTADTLAAIAPPYPPVPFASKQPHQSIAERNKAYANITRAFASLNSFIVTGHDSADEDCLGSALAVCLLLMKLKKQVTMAIDIPELDFSSLLKNIGTYNNIQSVSPRSIPMHHVDCIVSVDTAKPALFGMNAAFKKLFSDPSVLKIEFDHHVGTDSKTIGNDGFYIVEEATSTAELVFYFFLKLHKDEALKQHLNLDSIIDRNMVLCLLIAVLSDTNQGRFLPSVHYGKRFSWLIKKMNRLLRDSTYNNTNYMDSTQISEAISQKNSEKTSQIGKVDPSQEIYNYLYLRKKHNKYFSYVILNEIESRYLCGQYNAETIKQATRTIADALAEESKSLSLVGYIDTSNLEKYQLRMRRAEMYRGIDLRQLIEKADIKDGGGHPGAIGFRLVATGSESLFSCVERFITRLENIIFILLSNQQIVSRSDDE